MALYRKYRSKSLTEMVGQEHVTKALSNSIKSGRISHAYLFTGPRGVGKTSAARILAHEINELPYDGSQHLDIIEIDAASNRRIDDIRDLRDKVHIAPTSSKYKVYIIDEVHMLTGESFNALLKTLEEPPEHVVFILATTEVHKLPATIVSRTQRYNFRPYEPEVVMSHLRFIANQEKISVDDEALKLIAEHGEGSFRDSINLLDQLANVNNSNITAASVERSLGLAPKKVIDSLIQAIINKEHQSLLEQLAALDQQGVTTTSLLPQLIRQLQNVAPEHPELFSLLDQLLDVPRAYNPRLKLLTTLVQFALPTDVPTKPKSEPTNTVASSAPKHKTTSVAPTKPVLDVEKVQPQKLQKSEPQEPQNAQGDNLDDITPEQWSVVLERVKEDSAPMYGVLRQAEPAFDAQSQTLTLKFKYALHRRKAEDNKSKKALAQLMLEVLGGAPIINTTLDANVIAPDTTPRKAPPHHEPVVDETTKTVIAMMGGGEVVNA